ncbi:hypothetical protein [Chitinophaga flava]|uniref:Uncharacterized protein n=1 Tax=Chitinophaga flava TaxID=2259036 RepID=A0A365XWE2_9BACT|nr:hypothetical protein [Chitinophaga flava]RBL90024.1 hypothetical protein DF182_26490 [Chitinophaga flava]
MLPPFDLHAYGLPIMAFVMIVYVLWRHFFRTSFEDSVPVTWQSPTEWEPLVRKHPPLGEKQQAVFIRQLLEVAAWTAHLEKDFDHEHGDYSKVFRQTIPQVNGVPAFYFGEHGVRWNVEPDKVNIGGLLVDAMAARQVKALPSLQEVLSMGKVLAMETEISLRDGGPAAASNDYADLDDLPPIDTWFYLSGNGYNNYILYCWVPTAFEPLMQEAQSIEILDNYDWPDLKQLLPQEYC